MFADTGKTGQNVTNPREGVFLRMKRNGFLPGTLVTLGVIATIEILSSTAFYIPNAGVVVLLATAYAAFTGGTRSGLASAVLVSIYVAWNFSIPGELFRYSAFNFNRLMVFLIVAPAMALMVGMLRRRSSFYEEMAIANAALKAQMAERRETEARVLRERDFAENLLETTQAIVLLLDLEARIVRFNRYMEEISGYRLDEVKGKEWFSTFLPESDRDRIRTLFVGAINDTVNPGNINPILTRNGALRQIEWFWRLLKDGNGKPVGLLCTGQDITGRMAIEQQRRALVQHQRALLDGIAEQAWLKGADGRYLAVNHRFAELFGCSPDQLVGKTAADIQPPDIAHRYETEDREIIRTGQILRTERTRALDQGTSWREIIKVPIWNDDGRVVGIAGTIRDITGRKRIEEALRESEIRFRQLAENIREVFWVRDVVNDRILYVSPAYEQIWGRKLVSFDEAYRSFQESIHPDDRTRLFASMERESREKTERANEYRIVRPDGAVRWIRSRTFPVLDDSSNTYRVVGIAEDVTDTRHAEEERLAHALKQRDTLVREVHHRVKNNLQAVAGLLMHGTYDHPELQPLLQKAVAQVQLIAVVHGIQGAAKAREILLCEMVPAIARIVESLTQSCIEIDVNINMSRSAQICERESVPIALILNELLLNATKHSPQEAQPGKIKVTISRDGNSVEVRIFNPGSLPPGFNFAAGIATGTGLELVSSLMPRQGAKMSFRSLSNGVETALKLSPPIIDV